MLKKRRTQKWTMWVLIFMMLFSNLSIAFGNESPISVQNEEIALEEESDLQVQITIAKLLLEAYPEGSEDGQASAGARAALQAAIETAEAVAEDEVIEVITESEKALQEAIDTFKEEVFVEVEEELLEEVDFEEESTEETNSLQTKIDEANQMLEAHPTGSEEGEAASEARTALQGAIAAAEEILDDIGTYASEEIVEAENTLQEAMDDFNEVVDIPEVGKVFIPLALSSSLDLLKSDYDVMTQISLGDNHTVALDSEGKVYTWGNNEFGQLGLGDGVGEEINRPQKVENLSGKTIIQVSAGASHTVALDSEGTVFTWGNNSTGQLGDNTTEQKNEPQEITIEVNDGVMITQVTTGRYHTVVLASDGTVYTWGENEYGQLGDDTIEQKNEPQEITVEVNDGAMIQEVSAGGLHTVALANDGTVYTWGNNESGQLGYQTTGDYQDIPQEVTSLVEKTVEKVSAGGLHTVALVSDGTVYTWGNNSTGQLGDNTTEQKNEPQEITVGVNEGAMIQEVSAGGLHTVALASDGTVYTWGWNFYGQLGDGTSEQKNEPQKIIVEVNEGAIITQVSAGSGYSTAALASDGKVYMWGLNSWGQLGLGDSAQTTEPSPKEVFSLDHTPPTLEVEMLKADGEAYEDGTATNQTITVNLNGTDEMSGISDISWLELGVQVSAGWLHTVAIASNGKVYTWGGNEFGQLGYETTEIYGLIPQEVSISEGKTIEQVSSGVFHTAVLSSDGTVYTWGYNEFGQLGDGATENNNSPQELTSLVGKTIEQVSAGGLHTVAIASNGKVYTWGSNEFGQLGYETTEEYELIPQEVSIPEGKTIEQVSVGIDYTVALASDGTVYTWGNNEFGQLGLGDAITENQTTPQEVMSLSGKTIEQVSAGGEHIAVIDSDGKVYTWGRNQLGQLGYETSGGIPQRTPKVVTSIEAETMNQVSAGANYTSALTSDGTLYTWGENNFSQLGDGKTDQSTLPQAVSDPGGKTVEQVSAGGFHTVVIASDGMVYSWGFNGLGQLGWGDPSNLFESSAGEVWSWNEYKEPLIFNKEGTYEIGFRAVDEAGNESKETRTIKIDKTAPIITGVLDGRAYTGTIIPNSEDEGIAMVTLLQNGIEVSFKLGDSIYTNATYKLIVEDHAGNISEITFSKIKRSENRGGSNDKDTGDQDTEDETIVEKTTDQKFEELKTLGIFSGYTDGLPHLEDHMTREQAAKIIALLFGLDLTDSFEDADFTDISKSRWSYKYIEAASKVGIINGVGNHKFDPTGKVTIEQFIKMLVEGYVFVNGLEINGNGKVDSKNVSGWAEKYVAAAIKWELIKERENYRLYATREFLVEVAYTMFQILHEE
ncbi:S-layer homology domain-containing protein [Chengkuizengella sediminis]|uniref:RCC1 domain-containing protein n=1 Tax=Chengkuizengella sediminis TaxID=1885917 RepID=UPI001389A9FA|nr:S-layer homology domain-containing protein [Chengkuizengella sediminis]NDI35183.1 hypothetical protein [Chengkuizengella sediminis]